MDNKELSGVLFPRKKDNEKQPDFRGSALIGGVEYYVAGWKRTGKQSGAPYMSLAFQKKEVKEEKNEVANHQEAVETVAKAVNQDVWGDEVPF